jgi:hypothetical protein
MGAMNLSVTVRDATGQLVKPSKAPRVPWHESYRFFRLSQTTTDLFDAYRNAYLALESILAYRTPQFRRAKGQKDEPEREWFLRALRATGVDLAPFVDVPPGSEPEALYDAIYRQARVRVFHAKPDRDTLLPRDRRVAGQVSRALDLTRRLYLAIVEANVGMRRLHGGFSTYAVQVMAAAVFDGLEMVATSDETGLDANDDVVSRTDEPRCALPHTEPAVYQGFTARRRAWASAGDLQTLPFIRRVVGVSGTGVPLMGARLEGRLEHQGLGRLEMEFRLVVHNARDLRADHV